MIKALLKFARLQVIHSIPGRIRIKLPGLGRFSDKVKGDFNAFVPYKLKGIESMSVNFINSTVLIHYDEEVTNPGQITSWLNRLREIVIEKMSHTGDETEETLIENIVLELKSEGYEMEK